uniref:Neurotransmitter-gated ion-channel ligand-binding domain-containing protein n=1 Tax=Timema poppense TaxID=170557 RepID=A0A7R9CR93_TIMPO|nr:unnamed protein product [Timema poppensis]
MWFVRAGLNGPQIRIRSESEGECCEGQAIPSKRRGDFKTHIGERMGQGVKLINLGLSLTEKSEFGSLSLQGPHEKRLLHTLLDHYNVLERPVANESDPLQLSFGLTLMQIIDVVRHAN